MKLKDYLQDKTVSAMLYLLLALLILFLLVMFQVPVPLMGAVLLLMVLFPVIASAYDYNRKRSFYRKLSESLELLDRKYLVTEMAERPDFLEGQIFYDSLYTVNKAMYEELEQYQESLADYKEYVEMWIHEVKIPIASIVLILYNNKPDAVAKLKPQISRIEDYVEQVLYYVRSENTEKDYLIKECSIRELINQVVRKNQDALLLKKIAVKIEVEDQRILSDSKWLEFILNQIVSNSIKYVRQNAPQIKAYIRFWVREEADTITLNVEDNGIGICESDLPRVFEKSFTGENGRTKANSTGMGLYLAKKLCEKLGHAITVDAKKDVYTRVSILFRKDKYYKDVR